MSIHFRTSGEEVKLYQEDRLITGITLIEASAESDLSRFIPIPIDGETKYLDKEQFRRKFIKIDWDDERVSQIFRSLNEGSFECMTELLSTYQREKEELIETINTTRPFTLDIPDSILKKFENDRDVALARVKQCVYSYLFLPKRYQKDEEIAMISACGYSIFSSFPKEFQTQEKFYLKAIKNCSFVFKDLPDELKANEEVRLRAVQANGFVIQYIPKKERTESLILEALKQTTMCLQFLPIEYKNNKELLLSVLSKQPKGFLFIDETLKEDKDFVLRLVSLNGLAIEFIDEFKSDRDVALAAIQQNGLAISYFPHEIQESIPMTMESFLEQSRSEEKIHEAEESSRVFLEKLILEDSPLIHEIDYHGRDAFLIIRSNPELAIEFLKKDIKYLPLFPVEFYLTLNPIQQKSFIEIANKNCRLFTKSPLIQWFPPAIFFNNGIFLEENKFFIKKFIPRNEKFLSYCIAAKHALNSSKSDVSKDCDEALIKRKILSHASGQKGFVEGKSLERFSEIFFIKNLIEFIQSEPIPDEEKDYYSSILNGTNEKRPEEILINYQSGKPILFNVGYEGYNGKDDPCHHMNIVISGNHYFYINRGTKTSSISTNILYHEIDPRKVTIESIQLLMIGRLCPNVIIQDLIFNELIPSILKPEVVEDPSLPFGGAGAPIRRERIPEMKRFIENHLVVKSQKVANCTLANLKASIRVLAFLRHFQSLEEGSLEERVVMASESSKKFAKRLSISYRKKAEILNESDDAMKEYVKISRLKTLRLELKHFGESKEAVLDLVRQKDRFIAPLAKEEYENLEEYQALVRLINEKLGEFSTSLFDSVRCKVLSFFS